MKATGFGTLVLTATWAAFGIAFLLGAWGPGLALFGVLAVLAGTRLRLLAPAATVTREASKDVRQGAVLTLTTTVTGAVGGNVDVDAPVPVGMNLIRERRHTAWGTARLEQDVQAVAVGQPSWPDVLVHGSDPWGLWAETVQRPAKAAVTVHADARWALLGRRLGLSTPVQATIKARLASERGLDIERIRTYMPGDTVRDIDWKSTARLQELQVRERERHIPRPVTVVLDCNASMRVQRHDSKLVSAVRVARGTLAVASGAGTSGHLVSIHDDGCKTAPVGGMGDGESALFRVLAACPPVPPNQSARGQVREAAILAAIGLSPGVQVLVMDGETDPDLVLDLLAPLKLRGPVVLVVPATGAHLYRRDEARGPVLRQLRQWRSNRQRIQRKARVLGIPVHIVRPGTEEDVLRAVARSLQ